MMITGNTLTRDSYKLLYSTTFTSTNGWRNAFKTKNRVQNDKDFFSENKSYFPLPHILNGHTTPDEEFGDNEMLFMRRGGIKSFSHKWHPSWEEENMGFWNTETGGDGLFDYRFFCGYPNIAEDAYHHFFEDGGSDEDD